MNNAIMANDTPMPHHEARYQATKLAYFLSRGGREILWFRSRDFTPRQERAIRAALAEIRAGGGQ